MIRLVIARYNEPLHWVQRINPYMCPYIIYNKGSNDIPSYYNYVNVPNDGREAETYLRYIIEHYDSLNGHIMFCQGNPFDHMEKIVIGTESLGMNSCKGGENDFLDFIHTFKPNSDFTPLGSWYACNLLGQPHFGHDMKYEMDIMFSNFDNVCLWFVQGAQFIVSADAIRRRPLSFYKKLLTRGQEIGLNKYAYILERRFYIFDSSLKE